MAYQKWNKEERDEYFAKMDAQKKIVGEKRRQQNRVYHRTPIFIATLVLRILFLLFFTWIFIWNGGFGFRTKEIVTEAEQGIHLQGRGIKVDKLTFKTAAGEYEAHFFDRATAPYIRKGDTLLIEHNLFGKPSFFSRTWEKDKYELALSWVMYVMIAILTLISFMFNEPSSFDFKFLWLAWVANLFAFGHYFLS